MKNKLEEIRKKVVLNLVVSAIFLVSQLKYGTAVSLLDKLMKIADKLKTK